MIATMKFSSSAAAAVLAVGAGGVCAGAQVAGTPGPNLPVPDQTNVRHDAPLNPNLPTIFVVGDSTARNRRGPGLGRPLCALLRHNEGECGEPRDRGAQRALVHERGRVGQGAGRDEAGRLRAAAMGAQRRRRAADARLQRRAAKARALARSRSRFPIARPYKARPAARERRRRRSIPMAGTTANTLRTRGPRARHRSC